MAVAVAVTEKVTCARPHALTHNAHGFLAFSVYPQPQVLQGAVPLVMTHVPLLPGHEQHVSQVG